MSAILTQKTRKSCACGNKATAKCCNCRRKKCDNCIADHIDEICLGCTLPRPKRRDFANGVNIVDLYEKMMERSTLSV